MQEIIGRLLITQKGYSPTSLTFVDNIIIEAQVANKGEYVTVYRRSAEKMLRDLGYMKQFINQHKVTEASKGWKNK